MELRAMVALRGDGGEVAARWRRRGGGATLRQRRGGWDRVSGALGKVGIDRRWQGGRKPRLRCRTLQQWLRGVPLRVSGGWARAEAGNAALAAAWCYRKSVDRRQKAEDR